MLTVGFKKCRRYWTYGIFGVFRFLRTSGTIVQQCSQENEIQNLSQQSIACRKYFFDTLNRQVHYKYLSVIYFQDNLEMM